MMIFQDIGSMCNSAGRLFKFKGLLFFLCSLFMGVSFSSPIDSASSKKQLLINSIPGFSIQADSNGHYRGTVLINNVVMPFLIDTGATRIVVPRSLAYSARLPLGDAVQSSTANGLVSQRLTRIFSFKIGNIEVKNIDASVTDRLDEVLVGMNYLKLFRMTQDRNVLTLILTPGGESNIESVSAVPGLSPDQDFNSDLIKENSRKAYIIAKNEVADFKSQYKKPPECNDMQNNAMRVHCANEFIMARKAYEALHK